MKAFLLGLALVWTATGCSDSLSDRLERAEAVAEEAQAETEQLRQRLDDLETRLEEACAQVPSGC